MENVKTNSDGSITLTLQFPFDDISGERVETITLKRLKARHLRKMSAAPNMDEMLDIAQQVSGMIPKDFNEIDGADTIKVMEIVSNFLENGPQTGKTV